MADCDLLLVVPRSSEEFRAYYELRWRILRAPWHQPRGTEKDALEEKSFHVMACLARKSHPAATATNLGETVGLGSLVPIGVGRLHRHSEAEAQMRYMAVDMHHRHRGVGASILHALEHKARDWRADRITLHAREEAVGFYRRLGYQLLDRSHVLFGAIQHYRMEKKLSAVESGGNTRC